MILKRKFGRVTIARQKTRTARTKLTLLNHFMLTKMTLIWETRKTMTHLVLKNEALSSIEVRKKLVTARQIFPDISYHHQLRLQIIRH